MVEEVENNVNEEDVDNSEVAKLYRRLFDSFQEYLKNGGHAYVLDDSGYFDQFGFDAGDRKHAEELNSYANRKAIESVKKAGQQKTPEVTFAEDTLLRIRHFEKWDNQRLRDRGVYNQEKDAWKIYSWDNEEQRAKDAEIERQRREAEWQKEEAERQRREAEWQKRIEAERQKKEAEEAEKQRIEAERQKIEKENKEKTKSNNNAVEENSGGQNMNTEEKKTEPKTENKVKPQVEVKDFDFEKFLAQLGQENPDMSIIKEGVEKFGTGKLPDALKERFLKELFPEGNQYLSLGFEKMQGITNTMAALEDLSRNGKLSSEQVKGVLLTESPHNKRNMVSTLALNARAGDFKLEHMKDEEAKQAIAKNMDKTKLALGFLAELDKDMVKEVINTPDKSDKNFSLSGLEKSGKSVTLSEFTKSLEPIKIDGNENETEIGGNEGLNVDGQPKSGLTVNTPKNEEDDEVKEAKMDPQAGEDRAKREPFKFEKIKDQDIIQYMYENWLLEIMTGVIKAPFWVADKMLDALDSKYDTKIPTSVAKGEIPKNVDAIKFLNDAGDKAAKRCKKSLKDQDGYYTALFDTLKNNYENPDVKSWKIEKFAGTPVFDITDEADLDKMREFGNKILASGKSKNEVEQKFNEINKHMDEYLKIFGDKLKSAGILSATMYLANNIEGPFDEAAEKKVNNNLISYMVKLYDVSQQIVQCVEKEYRIANGLGLEAKLSPKDVAEIHKTSVELFDEYTKDIGKEGRNLRDNLNNYYNAKNEESKKVTKQEVDKAKVNLENMFSDKYIDEFLSEKNPNVKDTKLNNDEMKVSLLKFTIDKLGVEARNSAAKKAIDQLGKVCEGDRAKNVERKRDFEERVADIKGYKKFEKHEPWVVKSSWQTFKSSKEK